MDEVEEVSIGFAAFVAGGVKGSVEVVNSVDGTLPTKRIVSLGGAYGERVRGKKNWRKDRSLLWKVFLDPRSVFFFQLGHHDDLAERGLTWLEEGCVCWRYIWSLNRESRSLGGRV